jgi:hypothetical protein
MGNTQLEELIICNIYTGNLKNTIVDYGITFNTNTNGGHSIIIPTSIANDRQRGLDHYEKCKENA